MPAPPSSTPPARSTHSTPPPKSTPTPKENWRLRSQPHDAVSAFSGRVN
jgi:hypothetical protein